MFAKNLIDSDLFLDMPLSTQALYFHLAMRADDDGFVNNPKKISRMIGADDDSLKLLCAKQFLIPFENGVVVIRHWKVHNYIRTDRYKETIYQEEKRTLELEESGAYQQQSTVGIPNGIPNGNQTVYQMETQVRLGKDSIGKVNNIYDDFEAEFDTLWKSYPRKEGKTNALKAYIKARTDKKSPSSFKEVKEGLDRYVEYIKSENITQQYIKHGSTWFNQRCWNDEYTQQEESHLPTADDYDFSDWYNGGMK